MAIHLRLGVINTIKFSGNLILDGVHVIPDAILVYWYYLCLLQAYF